MKRNQIITMSSLVALCACQDVAGIADTTVEAAIDGSDTHVVDTSSADAPNTALDSAQRDAADDASSSPALPECINAGFTPPGAEPHHRLRMTSADGAVTATMWRCRTGSGQGHTALFRPDRFEVRGAALALVATTEQIRDYQVTHHNWGDSARVEVDGYTIHWRAHFQIFDDGSHQLEFLIEVARGAEAVLAETRLIEY